MIFFSERKAFIIESSKGKVEEGIIWNELKIKMN